MRGNQRGSVRREYSAAPVPGSKDQFKHSRVTDAKGKGLAPVWRGGCLGRDPDPAKADGPMKKGIRQIGAILHAKRSVSDER